MRRANVNVASRVDPFRRLDRRARVVDIDTDRNRTGYADRAALGLVTLLTGLALQVGRVR